MARWLIATLGGQPQVVTLTLDLLHRRGERIDEVIAVFPGGNARDKATHRRSQEAIQPSFRSLHIRYRPRPIDTARGRPLGDIQSATRIRHGFGATLSRYLRHFPSMMLM